VRAHFCGTRGSTPAPGAAFVRYGGHTSCIALSATGGASSADGPSLLLDAGTGLRTVRDLLDGRPFCGTVLLSHLHWDHVQGIPFFESGDRPDARVTMLIPPQEDGVDAETVLSRMMAPPLFPIWPKDLRGEWVFGDLPGAAFSAAGAEIEGFNVMARDVPHKGGRTVGYRVTQGGSSIAYIPDHCPTSVGPGPQGWGEYHDNALELARGVDVLVHDAHLLASEIAEQGSFGHAAADYAVGLGRQAGAAQVVLFHHSPSRTDQQIDEVVEGLTSASLPVRGAAQGTELVW
jgi:phosphoribosyl 1,2-cyclic phosphodiesterase